MLGNVMSKNGWWRSKTATNGSDAKAADGSTPPQKSVSDDVTYPMQRVMIRWHTLDGGEVAIPGQIQDVMDEIVEVWFDRNVASYNPLRSDDRIWLDTFEGN